MSQKYDLIDVVEDASKTGYSVGVFGAKLFYGVSGLANLGNAMDSFVAERFRQRLEYFTYEHNKLSDHVKKDFYDDLKNNTQNLNYLYEFVEKTRMTTFEIHAKLLARLSVNLIQNGTLNYYEKMLLSNISSFVDVNFEYCYEIINQYLEEYDETFEKYWHHKIIIDIGIYYQVGIIDKFSLIGVIDEHKFMKNNLVVSDNPLDKVELVLGEYAEEFYNILQDINIKEC